MDKVDAVAAGEVGAAAALSAAVRAAEAMREVACFYSSGQALQSRTRFRRANGQHLALERCRVGMPAAQSTDSPIFSYYDRA